MVEQETVDTLKVKHAKLEDQLDEESQRPSPDQFTIASIKRQKLLIKDRIAQLERA